MMSAAIRNERELTTKAVCRPKVADTMPPSADPTINIMPQVEPLKALAEKSSSGLTIFGMLALLAGAKKETDTASNIEPPYSSHSILLSWTSKNNSAKPADARFVKIIRLRRSKRSTTGPANGIRKNDGIVLHKITKLAPRPLLVSCNTNPRTATLLNQSPAAEITWAIHRRRKRPFCLSSRQYPTDTVLFADMENLASHALGCSSRWLMPSGVGRPSTLQAFFSRLYVSKPASPFVSAQSASSSRSETYSYNGMPNPHDVCTRVTSISMIWRMPGCAVKCEN